MSTKTFSHLGLLLLIVLVLGLFIVRLAAPSDLMDKDQERPASYVLDALRNGHWICQTDWNGAVMSKPPLMTWFSVLAALPFDHLNRFALYIPSAFSVLFLALILQVMGGKRFSPVAGFLGALMFVLSPISARLTVMARTDSIFTLTVALTALAAFRSLEKGSGWIWFWLAAAAATLAKGPLGVLIGAMGLLVYFWEKRSGSAFPASESHISGIALFLLLTLGWFALACASLGHAVVDKMIFSELIYHGVRGGHERSLEFNYFNSTGYFLHRFAPWSLIACVGLWRVFRRPAPDIPERRFERFLACWFLGGLIVFSVAPHQRGDLVYPIIPPAALLAGRELARWLSRFSPLRVLSAGAAVSALIFAAFVVYYLAVRTHEPFVIQTEGMRTLAGEFRTKAGEKAKLLHVDAPYSLQFFLNTMERVVSPEEAARQLAGTNSVYVAVCNVTNVTHRMNSPVQTIARWPETGDAFVTILGNR